ncbi:MAG TPA: DUF2892 domain-containing protein [Marinilabiliales bacterium]|nr:DUF2892 domain-containing protein [Salinivirgaceae bacterium]OFX36548.1 MAG: hypothetical protein A2W95_04955 [Bacteroidetes bacterium GWA2_40_14]OFX60452.1 MAG: hypothetical protein A2W84_05035 [Bacteroidetes bacterium GWC2_40_13]OFX75491.1 MAG: hypothetical protein A2W96_08535 [Bacteroidetes bacterium GWD2_40_43]OFX94006.1 MAG: hypothetical protein A2W97_14460 [Bacteroidetes bacterium GWE2_40_63]OFY19793.1 MAG: hypothetical protein A2W88_03330 [Bacteroidetes bacterium GWF2_40_13]OFZ28206
MKCNVGKTDKIIRLVIGLIIGAVGIYYQSWWGLIGIVPVVTALINWCPMYVPLKLTTKKD